MLSLTFLGKDTSQIFYLSHLGDLKYLLLANGLKLKKFIKAKLFGTPKNGEVDKVRSDLGGHLRLESEIEDFVPWKVVGLNVTSNDLPDIRPRPLPQYLGVLDNFALINFLSSGLPFAGSWRLNLNVWPQVTSNTRLELPWVKKMWSGFIQRFGLHRISWGGDKGPLTPAPQQLPLGISIPPLWIPD